MNGPTYTARYEDSHALVVGIDKYKHVSPLDYAVSDARAIAAVLIDKFEFSEDRVDVLLDDAATKENILKAYFKFASDACCSPDDRIIVFFAGHGHTKPGRIRDVGFLVPVDGRLDDLGSMIRWDDLTKNSELIPAKHMVFLMDACYGGLAITRGAPAGSLRFMTDMLGRYGRQVITAGKADEVVADSGGPLPDHSIFTGHLLQALEGKACTPDGILTGSGVMAYVYERVGKDLNSQQTPHYGFLEGDGDLIFSGLDLESEATETEEEQLVALPQQSDVAGVGDLEMLTKTTKSFLSDPRSAIELHDLAMTEVRSFLSESTDDYFGVSTPWADDEFRTRVKRYEDITARLCSFGICVAHWGKSEHYPIIQKTLQRMTDRLVPESGNTGWLALRWYPAILFTYSAGISAIAGEKYGAFAAIMRTRTASSRRLNEPTSLSFALADACGDITDAFKKFPGHERNYVPRSEYLFKLLQPRIDDLIFVGHQYEELFDRFEVLFALTCASVVSGPPGRFAYKYSRGMGRHNPLTEVLAEARSLKESWPPLRAGLFDGSLARFEEVATGYEEAVKMIGWL